MTLIKTIHIACAIVTVSGFLLRGVWMMTDSPMLQRRWVRIAPHVVDTVLLASAIWLVFDIGQYPGTHAWLTAKVIGLLAYIGVRRHGGPAPRADQGRARRRLGRGVGRIRLCRGGGMDAQRDTIVVVVARAFGRYR